jgi:hypothetical protein
MKMTTNGNKLPGFFSKNGHLPVINLKGHWSLVISIIACIIIGIAAVFPLNPNIMKFAGQDSGVFLYTGTKILNGGVPYNDVWDHKPPLIYFVDALALLITPSSLVGIFIIQVIFQITSNILVFFLLRKYIPLPLTLLLICAFSIYCLEFSGGGNLTGFYALPFQLLMLLLLSRLSKNYTIVSIGFLTGFSFICALMFRQTSISIFIGFAIISLLRFGEIKSNIIKFIGKALLGAAIIFLPLAIYFGLNNALKSFWNQAFYFNFIYTDVRSVADKIGAVTSGLETLIENGLLLFAVLGIFIICYKIIKRKEHSFLEEVAVVSFVVEWIFLYPGGRPRITYFMSLLPTFIFLSSVSIGIILNKINRRVIAYLFIGICLIFLSYKYITYSNYFRSVSRSMMGDKQEMIDFIIGHTAPDDKILVWGAESWIYFHSGRNASSKFIYQYPLFYEGYADRKMLKEFFSSILLIKPALIIGTINNGTISNGFGLNKNEETKQISAQIRELYKPITHIGDWVVYSMK